MQLGTQIVMRGQTPFAALWSSTTCGYLASSVAKFALPLFAARMTDSPLRVSGVTFALTVPWLLFGLPVGALVDRLDRRQILLAVHALRAVALGALALAGVWSAATLPLLYVAALMIGIGETCTETATTAIVPMVVSSARLEAANARLIGAQAGIDLVALPLGGALATLGLALAVGFGGAAYVVAFVALLMLRGLFRPERSAQRHIVAEVGEGLRFLLQHRLLRTIATLAAVINGCWTAWLALFVLYAVAPGPVGLTAFGYGLLRTAGGVGGILGAFLAVPIQRRLGRRWMIGVNIGCNTVMFAAPVFTANPWLLGAAVLVGDIGGPIWGVAASSLMQRAVPDALRGRAMAAYRFIGFSALALGPALGGIAAQSFGLRPVFAGIALLTTLTIIPFLSVITEDAMTAAHTWADTP